MSAGPIKILHVCPRPSFSGLEAYALAMATAQSQLGHKIEMVVLKGSPLAAKAQAAGLKIFEVESGTSAHLRFLSQMSRRLLGEDRPQILHLHSTQDIDFLLPALMASRLAGRARTKVVLQTHIWISHTKKDPLHAIAYSLIDELWCSSEPARQTLFRYIPIARRKIRVVNYGREISKIESGFLNRDEARRALGLPLDAIVVANVARIDEGKGTRELLEASLIAMAEEPRLHLMLIGPPTADDPKAVEFGKRILSRIEELPANLKGRVQAPGAVPESFKYLKAFDLFALPTYQECFALSLLEAQLAGLPCLATSSGGSPEVVREGETGWLFEPRSTEACLQALTKALAEKSQWAAYGEAAQKRVRKDFDFERILPTTVEFYAKLLG